ncbi:MAG: hypothetical protein KGV51_06705 [Moraxellaceae bacterium]|nr:hypothetical protein [Moraxellaceae bacterium]
MLKLGDIPETYDWNVTVKMPHNGSYKKSTVKVTFNLLPHDERTNLHEQIQQANESGNTEDAENDFFDKVFVGWVDGQIKDENGENLEVTEDSKQQMLSITEFRNAVIHGYLESANGEKQKN